MTMTAIIEKKNGAQNDNYCAVVFEKFCPHADLC